MKRIKMLGLVLGASLVLAASAWAAEGSSDPTLHEVYQAADSGHLDQAQQMMQQVLRDHPGSAKAHYVEAELLARQGRIETARAELGTAERLAPGLPFAKPGSVGELRQRLSQGGSAAPVSGSTAVSGATPASGGFGIWPWLLGALALFAIVRVVRGMSPPRPAAGFGGMGAGPGTPPAGSPGYGAPGYGAPGYGAPAAGMGSGILGGLATGAAVGAGVVAGEALMHRVLDGSGHHPGQDTGLIPDASAASQPDPGYDMGGGDFGVADNGSWDSDSGGGGGSDLGGDSW